MRQVCFYHAGCPDGFGAVWSVWRACGDDLLMIARGHEDVARAEEFEGDSLFFVDIAPPNDELRRLAESAARVTVLDHHISAQARYRSEPGLADLLDADGHEIVFDLEHSGAVLAWRFFHGEETTPDLLRYVEDQDLWNWKLPNSLEVNAAIASYPRSLDSWSRLAERSASELAREGEPIVRANRAEMERVLHHASALAIGTRRVEAVNASQNRAAIGHELAKRARFGEAWGCVYRLTGNRVHATLYSIGDLDVSVVATELGGGGHRNAAGFSVGLDAWLRDFVV